MTATDIALVVFTAATMAAIAMLMHRAGRITERRHGPIRAIDPQLCIRQDGISALLPTAPAEAAAVAVMQSEFPVWSAAAAAGDQLQRDVDAGSLELQDDIRELTAQAEQRIPARWRT